MAHPRRLLLLLAAVALFAVPAAATAATPLLRLDGIGPLKLGMKQSAAVNTGWLGRKFRSGCDAAGNPPSYHITGHNAPKGIRATAEFVGGRLNNISFTRGV